MLTLAWPVTDVSRSYCRGRQWPRRAALGLHAPALTLLLILLSAGLFMVDHVHFQYNGMLLGVLILGIAALDSGKPYWAAFLFSVLVNAKHLFLAVCPAVFVYLLRRHCRSGTIELLMHRFMPLTSTANGRYQWQHVAGLSAVGVTVFGASLGPFVAHGQLSLLIGRLFPVERGLYVPPSNAAAQLSDILAAATLTGHQTCGHSMQAWIGRWCGRCGSQVPKWGVAADSLAALWALAALLLCYQWSQRLFALAYCWRCSW